ncbi:MAG: aminotransferase class IV [Planctomycetota bacterium]
MIININGELLPPEKASISVLDHGFLFGDSVYEVIRTVGGKLFTADEHLARLQNSARMIALELPLDAEGFKREFLRTHEAGGFGDSYLRLIVTRGSGLLELNPESCKSPTWIIICKPLPDWGTDSWEKGIKVAIVGVQRNSRDALDPAIKSGNYLNNVLALMEAKKRGAAEGVMCNAQGFVTEGTISNIFCVRGGTLCTPALETGILSGITRQVIIGLAHNKGAEVIESKLRPDDFINADEVFLTSTTRGVMPVQRIDEHVIADTPGPLTKKLMAAYAELLEAVAAGKVKPPAPLDTDESSRSGATGRIEAPDLEADVDAGEVDDSAGDGAAGS